MLSAAQGSARQGEVSAGPVASLAFLKRRVVSLSELGVRCSVPMGVTWWIGNQTMSASKVLVAHARWKRWAEICSMLAGLSRMECPVFPLLVRLLNMFPRLQSGAFF